MGWGGKAASFFRGLLQTDIEDDTGRTVINRGQIGTVQYRNIAPTINQAITGVSRDNTGAILPNCKVVLFQTGGEIPTQRTVSDGSGNFRFDNPGTGPFFIVSYKPGAPDVTGATVNTLTAA
jgi:hypothetical protein